jgi:hypothetical protein
MENAENAAIEMPRYKCYKEVWALKIWAITIPEDTEAEATITPLKREYAPFKVSAAYIKKHDPQVGGYFVVYDGGYQSYSPCDAFESGYVLI